MPYDASVAAQQTALNAKGANLKVDGILGPLTQAAITKYSTTSTPAPATTAAPAPTQYANGLPPDDPSNMYNTATSQLNTKYKYYVAPAATPAPVAPTTTPSVLQQGTGSSTAPDSTVKSVQQQLGITADGIFGPQTKSAVMAFQEANGLVVDGIIGPKTTAALAKAATEASKTQVGGPLLNQNNGTTTKAPDDSSNQFNTARGQPNQNYKAPGSTSTTQNPQTEISNINESANADMEKMLEGFKTTLGTSVDVSDSSKLLSAVTDALSNLTPPAATSEAQTYKDQRAALGVGPLEDSLASINSEMDKLDADYKSLYDTEDNRQVSTSQINRRKSAEQITYEKQKAELAIKKNTIVNQLTQKYAVIDNIVKYTGDDAQTAQANYTNSFNKIITMANLIKGVQDDQKSDKEAAVDNARANATLLINTLKDKNVDFSKLDASTALDIKNLEISAGLPSGFIQFAMQATDQPIVSMGSEFTNASNQRQVPVYTKNPSTGVITASVITIGTSTSSSTDSSNQFSDFLKTGISPNGTKVGNPKGADGFYDPGVYVAAFNNWTGTTAEFLSKFPVKTSINPASYNLLPEAIRPSTREI